MATVKPSHPDAELHPEATGLAAKIVQEHQKEESLKLYSGWFCPFVQRVWAVLEEKKILYQYIEGGLINHNSTHSMLRITHAHQRYLNLVNPYNKPESLIKLNPRGLVPTLQYDNKPLYESTVICEFLEEAYPDHRPHLLPKDPYDRARTRIWTDFMTSRIIPAFHRFLQFQPMSDNEGLKQVREEFVAKLKEFTKEMDTEGPFFLGPEPSLVDFVVAPWVMRLWVLDYYKGGSGIPAEGESGGEDEKLWARWRKWVSVVENRKSIRETMSDRVHYLKIYQRYADNTAMSELAKATRQGRGVP